MATTTYTEKHPIWQSLMDSAYDKWQTFNKSQDEKRATLWAEIIQGLGLDEAGYADWCEFVNGWWVGLPYDLDCLLRNSFPHWSLEEFYAELTKRELMAVRLGNLNYQISNGGISQWECNGYRKASKGYWKQDLQTLGTPMALRLLALLKFAKSRPTRL